MRSFVLFDDMLDENNNILKTGGISRKLEMLVDENYADSMIGVYFEVSSKSQSRLTERGIKTYTIPEIIDENPDARFGFISGYGTLEGPRLSLMSAREYVREQRFLRKAGWNTYGIFAN